MIISLLIIQWSLPPPQALALRFPWRSKARRCSPARGGDDKDDGGGDDGGVGGGGDQYDEDDSVGGDD